MSDYTNKVDRDLIWNIENEIRQTNPYYGYEYEVLQSQPLGFQSFEDGQQDDALKCYSSNKAFGYSQRLGNSNFDLESTEFYTSQLTPTDMDNFEESPLLEELEIYPDRIFKKVMAVLNPFCNHSQVNADFLTEGADLAGPFFFCIILALSLFLSGSKVYFGYIYGLSMISCITMYCLLSLMTTHEVFTIINVSSILGYSLLPVVGVSLIGVFLSLYNFIGILVTTIAVLWSSLSASHLFITISGNADQRPLIAYPCALVCGIFTLLVIF